MLSKSKRLVTAQFDAVMKRGVVTHSPLFVLRHIVSNAGTKVSAVVPQKVSKTAAGRNKIRRHMYEVIEKLPISSLKSVHAILFAKSQATTDMVIFDSGIKEIFVKAGLLR